MYPTSPFSKYPVSATLMTICSNKPGESGESNVTMFSGELSVEKTNTRLTNNIQYASFCSYSQHTVLFLKYIY